MSAPVIFLDFDGPLRNLRVSTCGFDTDPVLAATLHQTLADLAPVGARLVVSSSWRHSGKEPCFEVLDTWREWMLTQFLAEDWMIGGPEWTERTPSSVDTRADNIIDWLRRNDRFALSCALIIDDYELGRRLPLCTFAKADEVDGLDGPSLRRIVDWKGRMLRECERIQSNDTGAKP